MANLSKNHGNALQKGSYLQGYNSARNSILLVVIFSALNTLLLITNAGYYFLFSATIPYTLVDSFMYLCGKYPMEYYGEDYFYNDFLPPSYLTFAIIVAVALIALYAIMYLLSKKQKVGFLIATLALFAIDTASLFYFYGISSHIVIDLIFHACVLFSLSYGVYCHFKLKKLADTETCILVEDDGSELTGTEEDSTPIRYADLTVKSRTLLESTVYNHKIIYRRVKRTNELVIDGRVYDEYVALMEKAHSLSAIIGGHEITVGFNGSFSYITVDGKEVGRKLRLF